MIVAACHNVTKQYGPQTVLDNVSFHVDSGHRIGLIGPNGSGKTTLIRILLGLEEATAGSAEIAEGVRVGYVPQYVEYDENETVMECVLSERNRLAQRLKNAEQRLAAASEADAERALLLYQRVRDEYDRIDGDHLPQRAIAMLDALGLKGRADQRVASLSGGERNVLSLTKALLTNPDFLVLDEPANHLDYLGVAWLEDFLIKFKGTVLIVSHNRYLLDRVATGIFHLNNAKVEYYKGGYSDFRTVRLRRLLAQQADYEQNQKRLAKLEQIVQKFEQIAGVHSSPKWGKRLRAQRTLLEREKANAVEKPDLREARIGADFSTEASRADVALQVNNYSKSFGDNVLFRNASMEIRCGDKVALVGPNGSGKTTILKDIVECGDWNDKTIRVGPSLSIGYCSQEQEVLDSDRTVIEELMAATSIGREEAMGVLARFLFTWDDRQKKVRDLSGGERNRLQLAKLVVQKPNFLILDEPTNHLDIPAREAIEEALENYEGTLLVVSHDRYFLDKVATRVIEIREKKLVSYQGNFTDFWAAREQSETEIVGRISSRRKQRKGKPKKSKPESKEEMLARKLAELEQQKTRLERQSAQAFARNDHKAGHKAVRQLESIERRMEEIRRKMIMKR